MRLTAILLFATFLTASARSGAQTVTLSKKEAPLQTVLHEIEVQTGYQFFYKTALESKFKPVTVNVKGMVLTEALTTVLKDQELTYEIVNKTIVLKEKTATIIGVEIPSPPPPLIDVKGRVVDEDGKPVIATVNVKNTNLITTTNDSGYFELLAIDGNSILIISAVNIRTKEVKVDGKTALGILTVVSKIGETGEVTVSTGYQKSKANELTGSVEVVSEEKLNQQLSPNIIDRLNGVSSILFDNKTTEGLKRLNLTIRGLSTINGSVDPLIVLDNFIYDGDLSNINPDDVESVSILKDAAASSIWGSRAGNGVIVITTKKAKLNQRLKVQVNSNISWRAKPDLFSLPLISTTDFIDVEQFLFSRGFRLTDTANTNRPSLTPIYEILLKRRNGQISAADAENQINALRLMDSRKEYLNHMYQNGIRQQYSINLSGGSKNNSWIISAGYNKIIGETRNTSTKYNVKLDNSYIPLKNLKIDFGVYFTNSNSKTGGPSFNGIRTGGKAVPYLSFVDQSGNPYAINHTYRQIYTDTVGAGRLLNWKYYPLEDFKHDYTNGSTQQLITNVAVSYSFFKKMDLNIYYQFQKEETNSERYSDIESFYTRDIINKFTVLASNPSLPDTFNIPKGDIVNRNTNSLASQNLRFQLNFSNTWQDHSITTFVASEFREVVSGGFNYRLYGYIKEPKSHGTVNYLATYKSLVNGSLMTIDGAPNDPASSNLRSASILGNLAYTYKRKYILSLSSRKDAANVFGVTTNDRWKPLWSSGIAWILSNEQWFKYRRIFQFVKLNISYGHSGNLDSRKTPLPIASSGTNTITNFPIRRIITINDPSLRWEEVRQLNFGIEFKLKNQLLSGSINYYQKNGTDLYGPSYYDYTGWGISPTITRNTANTKGKGIEISLNSKIVSGKFNWSTSLNFNYNNTIVTKYDVNADNIISLLTGGGSMIPLVGKPLYALSAYKWGGLNSNGDPLGYVNGNLSTDYTAIQSEAGLKGVEGGNIKYIGPATPPFSGNITNSFQWRSILLSFNVGYNFGYFFRKPNLSYSDLYNSGLGHSDFERRWRQPGDELVSEIPSMVYTDYPQYTNRESFYRYSEVHVLKADHIRLRNINLTYSLRTREKGYQIQFYLNAQVNTLLWCANEKGLDPEYASSIIALPPSKEYAIGVRLSL